MSPITVKWNEMQIVVDMGMVNIDTDRLAYANIRNMYQGNKNGAGIQLDEKLDAKRDDIVEVCDQIASLIYKLEDLTK